MSPAQPPRFPSWLLRRFPDGPRRESLIGDLDEQFARGRSSFWYWRQVLSAILVTCWRHSPVRIYPRGLLVFVLFCALTVWLSNWRLVVALQPLVIGPVLVFLIMFIRFIRKRRRSPGTRVQAVIDSFEKGGPG